MEPVAEHLAREQVDELAVKTVIDGVGAFHLRLMAHTGNEMQHAARNRVVRRVRVGDRDATVLFAEDDQCRQVCAQSVQRADRLATVVDDRAQCPQERGPDSAGSTTPPGPFNVSLYLVTSRPEDSARLRSAAADLDRRSRDPISCSAISAPGSDSIRNSRPRSGPRPPLLISTSRRQYSLCWWANCRATPPPNEWPITVASRMFKASRKSRSHTAKAPKRVVAARLVGLPVAEEINGDDAVPRRQLVHHAAPAVRTSADAVDQQQHIARALVQVRHPVAVQGQHHGASLYCSVADSPTALIGFLLLVAMERTLRSSDLEVS